MRSSPFFGFRLVGTVRAVCCRSLLSVLFGGAPRLRFRLLLPEGIKAAFSWLRLLLRLTVPEKRPNVGASDPRRPDTETVAFLSLRAGGSAKSGLSATGACCCARSQIREDVRFGSPGGCPRGFLLSDRVRYLQWLGGIRKDVFSLFYVSFFVVAEAMAEVRCRLPQRAVTVRNTCRPSAGAGGFLFENSLQNVKFILRASEYN